jgi:hypothetical protein
MNCPHFVTKMMKNCPHFVTNYHFVQVVVTNYHFVQVVEVLLQVEVLPLVVVQ